MKTFELPDKSYYTNSEFFLAQITAVCDKESIDACSNFPCSWQQYQLCDNLSTFTDVSLDLIYGDCVTGQNVAYPISGGKPAIGDIVLMRYRGTIDQQYNVFEFIGGGQIVPTLALTAIQCSGGILTSTYSDGCIKQ